MDNTRHREHARILGARIAAVGRNHDSSTPVPSCPEWDLGGLLFHTGGFCRFARSALEQGTAVEPGGLPHLDYSDFDPAAGMQAWHEQEFERLLAVLDASDPTEPNWAWGSDQRKAFWFRRCAQELAMHCWDGENAVGATTAVDAELAADGIDELLTEFGATPRGLNFDGVAVRFGRPGATLHLHATDVDEHPGEWMVVAGHDAFEVTHEHGKGDAAARGTASDLLLFLYGRGPLANLEVFGDVGLLTHWETNVRI